MRARPYKQDSRTAFPSPVVNDEVKQALEEHAARRGPKTPPKIMPVTPMLKKVPKLYRKRKSK